MNAWLADLPTRWKRALGWLLAAGLLLLLFANSRPFDSRYHSEIVTGIGSVARYDAELSELVLKQHFHLHNNFDVLVEVAANLRQQVRDLKNSEAIRMLRGESAVQAELSKMDKHMLEKLDMLEQFKSSNAVLRNSLVYLPYTIDDLLRTLPPQALHAVGLELRTLKRDLLVIYTNASALNLEGLRDDVAALERGVARLPESQRHKLAQVVQHTQTVASLELEAVGLLHQLTLSNHESGMSDAFAAAYSDFYDREELRADRYRLLMLVVALAMMSYAIYAYYHMRKLNTRMQRALADVRNQKVALDAHAIVSTTDVQGNIRYVNQRFLDTSKYSEAELLGKNHRLVNSGYHSQAFFRELWDTVASGKIWHGQVRNRAKDGSFYWVEATVVPFMDETGKPYQYVAVRTDITQQKIAAQEALLAKEAAETASKVKGDFLATMSHEIRTPMNGIIGMAELALDTELNTEQREYLGMVKSSADALLVIINDILDFSKIESGKMELEQVGFDIRELLAVTVKTFAIRAAQKDVALRYEVDREMPETLLGDPGRLRQVLTNLLGNAIKFSDHGEVAVRIRLLQRSGDEILTRFEVADQGIGIPAEKQAGIFEAFTQADTSTTRQYGGTGLGLAISAQLVAAMGGHLGVESEVGQGSIFSFEVAFGSAGPAAGQSPGADAITEPARPNGPAAAKLDILLAEDNPVNQKLAVALLEKWGHRVELANNGIEAVEMSANRAYDAILMDLQMPVMGGLDATQLIRERERRGGGHTPIFAMTANVMSEDKQRCLDAGMDGYVSKPIVAEKLRAVLQGLRPDMAGVSSVPTGAAPVFDYGAALGKADAWVIETIGAVFLDDCDRQMQEITDAVREQDAVLLLRGAHTLRGLVGNFNASRIVELAHRIESLAEQGDMQRAAEPAELLRHELELLKSALTAYLGAKRS